MRIDKPGNLSVPQNWKQQLRLAIAGSSFKPSELLASRSLVSLKQSVKLRVHQSPTFKNVLSDGLRLFKVSCLNNFSQIVLPSLAVDH